MRIGYAVGELGCNCKGKDKSNCKSNGGGDVRS